MLFNYNNYPDSFSFLHRDLLKKAIEIANQLHSYGFKENVAEQVAVSSAKLWGDSMKKKRRLHLIPHPEGWALITHEGDIIFISSSRSEALVRARMKAKTEKQRLYIHSLAGNISDSESFFVNSPQMISRAWQEETLKDISQPENIIQERTREAIRKAESLAYKFKSGLSLNNEQGDLANSLFPDY
jgi:hypothetical protein